MVIFGDAYTSRDENTCWVSAGRLGEDTLKGGNDDGLQIGGFGDDSIDSEKRIDKAIGGPGKIGESRFGYSAKDLGDVISADVIDELFATLFSFE